MVTTTTKQLNYSNNTGTKQNEVNATLTSTPGFNGGYFGKVPGMLKLFQLILTVVALALAASQREESRPRDQDFNATAYHGQEVWGPLSYLRERFLVGEVYFLCAHTAALVILCIFLISYLFHTISSMLVPKGTTLEMVMNMVMFLVLMAAGIVEIVMTEMWKREMTSDVPREYRYIMPGDVEAMRLAAGILAIINSLVFLASYFVAKKELDGPNKNMGG